MPTYEYECSLCGLHFEKQQSIKDEPLKECPECKGPIQRLVSGGKVCATHGRAALWKKPVRPAAEQASVAGKRPVEIRK